MHLVAAAVLNVILGLVLEAWAARENLPYVELLVGVATLAHLAIYVARPPFLKGARIQRQTLFLCLVLATIGEVVLSAVLNLYRYRQSFLPLFVPPGHVLLFLSGLAISEKKWCGRWLIGGIAAISTVTLIYNAVNQRDLLSIPLFLAWTAFCIWGHERKLYVVMFALAWMLEIVGTSLGSWTWEPQSTYIHLSAANPPLAAGAFYACLDLLTFHAQRHLVKVKR